MRYYNDLINKSATTTENTEDLTRLLHICYSLNRKMVKRYKTKAELESTVIRINRNDYQVIRDLAENHGWSIGEVVSLLINSLGDEPRLPDRIPAHQLLMPEILKFNQTNNGVTHINPKQVIDNGVVHVKPKKITSNGTTHINPKTIRKV